MKKSDKIFCDRCKGIIVTTDNHIKIKTKKGKILDFCSERCESVHFGKPIKEKVEHSS